MSSPGPLLNPAVARAALNRQALWLGLLALLLFIAGVGLQAQAVVGFDSRFVLFAKEMLRHGPGFFATTYGEPYPDYPATSTLFIYLLSLPFGEVSNLTAWLPTALSSALIVALVYRLVAPYSVRWALLSVALLLLTSAFISETRAVSLDQMVSAVALAAFYLAHTADRQPQRGLNAWLGGLLLLGFAIRGPLGLVVPAGVVCSYYLMSWQWRRLLGFGFAALFLLALCCLILLGLAHYAGGPEFVQEVLRMQVIGRIDGSAGESSALYYFSSAPGNYALAFPLALLVLVALVAPQWRTPGDDARRLVLYCAAAGLIVMLGLSIPHAKKARYILPMAPLAAIIAAYPFQLAGNRLATWLRYLLQGIWLLLPVLLIVLVLLGWRRFPEQTAAFGTRLEMTLALLLVLQGAAVLLLFKAHIRAIGLAACAVLAVWGTYILAFEPIEHDLYDTRRFSLAADALIAGKPAPLAFYGLGKDAKAIKYLVNLEHDQKAIFFDRAEQLRALSGPFYLMMDAGRYAALKGSLLGALPPVLQGKFEKDPYVLLFVPGEQPAVSE